MNHSRLVGLGLLLAFVVVLGLCWRSSRVEDSGVGSPVTDPIEPASDVFELASPRVDRRAPAPTVAAPESTAATVLATDASDLIELLRAVTRAERAGDGSRLELHVLEALSPRHGLGSVLGLLEHPGFDSEAEPLAGALTVAALAATRERAHGEDGTLAAILSSLPFQIETARARLPVLLSSLEVEGLQVLGAGRWPRLLALQRAHPELAEDFGPLFAHLHRDEAGLVGLTSVLQEASGLVEFPQVVAAAIEGLSVLDPALGASLLADLRARGDIGLELERELARISATRLPPAEAADVLAAQSRSIAMEGMLVLGDRPEAGEALRQKYNDLAVQAGTERDRMNVISGMRNEESRVLLSIAQTDASVRVREQALLMLTSSRSVEAETVHALHALRHAGADSIQPRYYTSALANVVVRSSGAAREEALRLLRGIVDDPTSGDAERQRAVELLEKHAPSLGEARSNGSSADQAGK